jgi:hypothetical protein
MAPLGTAEAARAEQEAQRNLQGEALPEQALAGVPDNSASPNTFPADLAGIPVGADNRSLAERTPEDNRQARQAAGRETPADTSVAGPPEDYRSTAGS